MPSLGIFHTAKVGADLNLVVHMNQPDSFITALDIKQLYNQSLQTLSTFP